MGEPDTGSGAAGNPARSGSPDHVMIFLRPMGSPVSLDIFALAVATTVLSGLQLGWVAPEQGGHVALVLIGFAFPAQAIAAIFALLARDGAAATAMAVLSFTWLVVGLVLLTSAPGATSDVLGLFLLVAAIALAFSGLAAGLSKIVPSCVFLLASVRLAVTAVYELTAAGAWQDAAGVTGIALSVLALYTAGASLLEDAVGRTILPLGRHGMGETALRGDLSVQVKQIAAEPGIRNKL